MGKVRGRAGAACCELTDLEGLWSDWDTLKVKYRHVLNGCAD